MKNTYNITANLMNGGLLAMLTNKQIKASKRYAIYIICILFYLVLIGLCFFNGIGNFNINTFLFVLLNLIGIILVIDLLRLMNSVEKGLKK